MTKLYNLADRISNRLMRHLPNATLQAPSQTPIVSFTFDDAPDTALTSGAQILETHGVRGTFYIAGGLAGRTEPGGTMISSAGCRQLAERGHEVGCHTFSHPNVRRLNKRDLASDLDKNAAYLTEAVPGLKARNFAFPYNLASPLARRALADRYRSCRGGWEGINRGPTDAGYLKAVGICPSQLQHNRTIKWIDDVVASPGWLIFFTHDVSDRPTPFGCTPEVLDALVARAKALGCAILPVDHALDQMQFARQGSPQMQMKMEG